VFVIATIAFVACHNESDPTPVDDGIEYLIPDDAEVIVDAAGLFKTFSGDKFITTFDGDFCILIGISARRFYLPKEIKNYQKYYDLITADREPNILKFTIGSSTDKGDPIIKVELPDEKSEEYLKAKNRVDNFEEIDIQTETKSATSLSDVIPNVSTMNTVFSYLASRSCHLLLANPCIPFQYAYDGCYARAHYMRKILDDNYEYNCWKIFAIGNLAANTQPPSSCCVTWGWHVAPVVRVGTTSSYTEYVLDPSLFSSPVSKTTWLNKLKGSACVSGDVDDYVVVSGTYYGLNGAGNLTTDPNYTNTNYILNYYSTCSGCSSCLCFF
jgi:hypothetical protein